jgi:hypothetical protein
LSNGHIDQFVEIAGPYQVQLFLKLGVQALTEAISFVAVSVRIITRVLAQVIENLCILHDSAGFLSQIQKFIELSLNESLGNVVCSESGPKFIPCDDMTSRLHSMVMVPPYAGGATKLLGCKECLIRI